MKLATAGERDSELRGKWQKDFESPVPVEVGWREVLVSVRIIADRADVVSYES